MLLSKQLSLSKHFLAACLTASVAIWATGCPSPGPTNNAAKTSEHSHDHGDHDHAAHGDEKAAGDKGGEHAHDHSHAHGPHGGHIVEIGEEEYHAEWLHAEDGTVTVYVLDKEMKNEVPIAAETITIDLKIGETPKSFTLEAVQRSEGDMPKTAKFEVTDKGLVEVLKGLGGSVTATLKLDIDGKPYTAAITHDDHGHKH
jgi:hypothetical protein